MWPADLFPRLSRIFRTPLEFLTIQRRASLIPKTAGDFSKADRGRIPENAENDEKSAPFCETFRGEGRVKCDKIGIILINVVREQQAEIDF
jgi:hypothetical protein